jgi:hypothetical protein
MLLIVTMFGQCGRKKQGHAGNRMPIEKQDEHKVKPKWSRSD